MEKIYCFFLSAIVFIILVSPTLIQFYHVLALDANNTLSDDSILVEPKSDKTPEKNLVTARDTTPPTRLRGLSIVPISSTQLQLKWSENKESDLHHYIVYKGTKPNFAPVLTSNTNSYSSKGLTPSTVYYYRVAAVDNAGNISPLSSVKSGRTQIDSSTENKYDIPPSQVVGVVVSVASSTTLKLAWTQNTELDFGHYNIYSGTKEGFNVTPVLTSIANSVSITGLNPSTKYYYRIAAVDNTGNILSSEVSASTPSEQNITSSSKEEVRNNNQNPTSEIAKQDTGNHVVQERGVENKNIISKYSYNSKLGFFDERRLLIFYFDYDLLFGNARSTPWR